MTNMHPNRRPSRRAYAAAALVVAVTTATLALVNHPRTAPASSAPQPPSGTTPVAHDGRGAGRDGQTPTPGHDDDWAVEQVAAVRAFRGPIYTLEDAGPEGYPIRENGTGAPTAFVEVAPGHVSVTTLPDGAASACQPGTRASSQGAVTITCTELAGGAVLASATLDPNSPAAQAGPAYTVDVPAGAGADVRIAFTEEAWAGPETAEAIAEAALDRLTELDKDVYTAHELAEALEAGHADH